MQIDKIPKIFISYSWSSDALVLELANRLVFHGVDVVLDKWDLKEGNDKYEFKFSSESSNKRITNETQGIPLGFTFEATTQSGLRKIYKNSRQRKKDYETCNSKSKSCKCDSRG